MSGMAGDAMPHWHRTAGAYVRIRIAGAGYRDVARGACLAEPGHDVLRVDTEQHKVLWPNVSNLGVAYR